jgi:hypothetical protein
MKELKFIHIPRNAGSSIELLGKTKKILWGQFDEELENNKTQLKISYWHTPLYEYEPYFLLNYLNKYDLFAVVRNPYEKCISEYYFFKNWNKNPESEFELNNYINNNLIDKNNIMNDGHFIPQYKYLFDKNMNLIVNNVLKFENLENDFDNLMKKYNYSNIKITNFKVNTSNKTFTIDNLYKETIERINSYYHIDFIMFEYKKI